MTTPRANVTRMSRMRTKMVRGEEPPRRVERAMGGNLASVPGSVKERLPLGAALLEVTPVAQPRRPRRELAGLLGVARRLRRRQHGEILVRQPDVVDGEEQPLAGREVEHLDLDHRRAGERER